MDIPKHIYDSLDLIPVSERNRILHSLERLKTLENNPLLKDFNIAKLVGPNLYIYRGSARIYRIVFERKKGKIRITDIVHHDKIRLVLSKRRTSK